MPPYALALVGCLLLAGFTQAQQIPNYSDLKPQDMGVVPVAPQTDPKTGFVIAGKNPTQALGNLTEIAGIPIAQLEKDMRPGQLSGLGFLGKDERLLDILTEDNRFVVDQKGLTHQQLALPLHLLGMVTIKQAQKAPIEFRYQGRHLKAKAVCFRGIVLSPFRDGTKTNCEITLWNLDNGKRLTYSLLVPHLIERYGFYEGKGTPYRVDPRNILEVLDFIPAKK